MFNIVLNIHELFDAGRDETMFEIVLNIHELFAAWGEEYCLLVYSNLPCQINYSLQQFTVSRKLPLTAIYRVKQITVYSNKLCQAN
jgi:hypothetical protein